MHWLRERLATRLKDQGGFTLIELLVVVGILAVLAAIAVPRITEVISKSKEARSRADLKVLSGAIERFYSDRTFFPANLNELKTGGYIKFDVDFKNAYGKYYLYVVNRSDANNRARGYLLMDPGVNPLALAANNTRGTIWLQPAASGVANYTTVIPEGTDGSVTLQWDNDAANPTIQILNQAGAALVSNPTATPPVDRSSIGAYCMTQVAANACRTDIHTD